MIWLQLAIARFVPSVGVDAAAVCAGFSYLDAVNALWGGRDVYLELCCVVLLSDGVDMIGLLNVADC